MGTIRSSKEISHIFQEGRRLNTPELTLIAISSVNQHGHKGRVAFIAGKKLGNAVWRNRAKRRMRAVFRALKTSEEQGINSSVLDNYDVVFLAKSKVTEANFDQIVNNTLKALNKLT